MKIEFQVTNGKAQILVDLGELEATLNEIDDRINDIRDRAEAVINAADGLQSDLLRFWNRVREAVNRK